MNEPTDPALLSLQERFSPEGTCFGCGPANPLGLQIRSFFDGEKTCAKWSPQRHHEAFQGYLNGGIISTLLDCHCNWGAIAHHWMGDQQQHGGEANENYRAPCTVTAKLEIEYLTPTPTTDPIELIARVIAGTDRKFDVEGELVAGGKLTARCRALFVAVQPSHPAYHRW